MLNNMTAAIKSILEDNLLSLYLHGSLACGDYHPGWSDIDILCLTHKTMPEQTAHRLLMLRQQLVRERNDPVYRTFEGGFVPLDSFARRTPDVVVYWGTSGQRLTDIYDFNALSTTEWLDGGRLLSGEDIRGQIDRPHRTHLRANVETHYRAIRTYAGETGASLYSAGWMLDIARCLYTLRTGKIAAKTEAGEWALREGLAPDAGVLRRVLDIRREPLRYKEDPDILCWLASLGPRIQAFADVLEAELYGG